ncbi:hypothetical protein ACRN9A_16690 [Shewanella frigidimarina]|uniref:hypothetical protein n=1 Tax=Shewanella frigidimarina TaxID=56812 RepID=UPI003D78CB18
MLNMMPTYILYRTLRSNKEITFYESNVFEWAELTGAIKISNWCYSVKGKQTSEFTALLMNLTFTDVENINTQIINEQRMIEEARSSEQFEIYNELELILGLSN